MPRRADRVQETCSTTGTGPYTTSGVAVAGYQTFASAFAGGSLLEYAASDGTNWEVGLGTYDGATGLTRDMIRASSNGGNAVNWSGATVNIWSDIGAGFLGNVNLGRQAATVQRQGWL
ncbi:MAG TPA: hypothetical protein VN667_14870 [Burkholderiales bacterium]|nr:hypothetical protein [Burkholderiales bacterium]